MTFLKRIGLAMVVLGALALLAAGSAAAETTLCKANESPCVGNGYGVNTVIKGTASGNLQLGSTGGGSAFVLECGSSTLEATLESTTTPKAKINSLTWNECNYAISVTVNGSLAIRHDAESNGNVTVSGITIQIKGTPAGTCIYGGTLENVTLTGGSPAHLVPTDFWVSQAGSGFFCPPHLMWIDSYELSQPKPLYVSSGL
jgi:hypothetical protein